MLLAHFILPLVVSAIISCNVRLETDVAGLSKRDVGSMTFLSSWRADFQIGSEEDNISLDFHFYSNRNYLPMRPVGCNASVTEPNEFANSTTHARNNTCVFSTIYGTRDLTTLKSRYNSSKGSIILTDRLAFGDNVVGDVDLYMVDYGSSVKIAGSLGLGQPNDAYFGYHKNFVQQLHENGVIESSVLSLWLDPGNHSVGLFAFGGIDEAKYSGSLFRFPMLNSYAMKEFSENLEIKMDSFLTSEVSFTQPVGFTLDPGASSSQFPQDYFDAFAKVFDGVLDESIHKYAVDKKYLTLNEIVTFTFGNFDLSVPIASLVEEDLGEVYTTFELSVEASLGLDVLRHAYIAIDYDNYEIALGQSNTDGLDSEKLVSASSNLDFILMASGASDTSLAIEIWQTLIYLARADYYSERNSGTLRGCAALTTPLVGLFGLIAGILMGI